MPPETLKTTLETAGGRIRCLRCLAQSKRTKTQCKAPASKYSRTQKCKWHGGVSTGPRTQEGRIRCAEAKTIHGRETRQKREESREISAMLKCYASLLGIKWRSDST